MGEKAASRPRAGLGTEFRLVFSAMALASLVLGYVGLREVALAGPGPAPGVPDLVYWDLQLFVLGSSPLDDARDLPVTLEIARFMAPAATAYALFTTAHALLRSQVELVRARRSRGHTVVCGSEPAIAFLARRLVAEGRRVVMIDPARSTGPAEWVPPAGILVVAGDPRDREVLRRAGAHRAREIMACTADSAFNAEVVLAMDALTPRESRPVACYAEVDDRELCAAMVARRLSTGSPSRLTVEFFSRHDRAARRLADRGTLVRPDPSAAVLVAGVGPLARALVVELARRWRPHNGAARPLGAGRSAGTDRDAGAAAAGATSGADVPGTLGSPLPVAVLGAGAGLDSLVARLPLSDRALALDVRSTDPSAVADASQLRVHGGWPTHVFVCLDDDTAGIRFGLVATDLLDEVRPQVVVAVVHGTVFGRVLDADGNEATVADSGGPILHNVTDAVYSPEAVRRGMVDDIARSAHETYVAAGRSRGETAQDSPAIVPWDRLPERLRQSNRAQAADIGNKLAAIGCAAVPTTVGDATFAFEPGELERLSRVEHDRWVRAMRAEGWTYGPESDERTKRDPDLVAWEDLTDEGRDKDRSAVRAIPGQLRAAGFTIIRRPP